MSQETNTIEINTEFIRLDALLKFTAVASSGGEAKQLILNGQVQLNGETCTQRTRKIRAGDTVTAGGETFVVSGGQQ